MSTADLDLPQATGRRYRPTDRFRVLIVDPDPTITAGVASLLDQAVIDVVECTEAADALFQAGRRSPDLILLSLALRTVSACDFMTTVRSHDGVPVLIGVGEGETELVGPALFAGASEVLTHPYREADIRDVINRYLPDLDDRRVRMAQLVVGEVELNGPAMSVTVCGKSITLPLLEFELLRLLMLHAGRVVTYGEIQDQVWGARGREVTTRTVSSHIYRLRCHLTEAAELVPVRGIGYRLMPR